jgi:DNA (cytosine-5)-methyltransferase 1
VTVTIDGNEYAITDIGMRMLEPRELAAAMGFPADYQWTGLDGKPLTKRDQVKLIGNACPVNTVCELIKSVVRARPAYGVCAA